MSASGSSPRFRVVYVNNPFSGTRLAIAALVLDRGVTTVVATERFVLDDAWELMVEIVLEDLRAKPSFEVLPIGVGPSVSLSEVRGIPDGAIGGPIQWVLSATSDRGMAPHG